MRVSGIVVVVAALVSPAAAQEPVAAVTASATEQATPPVPVPMSVPPPASVPQPAAPPSAKAFVARWVELQNGTLNLRYRFVDNSAGTVTTNQLQHRESLRGRLKFDAPGRYSLNFGIYTGVRFTSGWDNTGWGTNGAQKNLAFKVLYGAAQPIRGVELQIGGLTIVKGESTELTTYDEDGFITGERISVRRPKELFFDEISVTSAHFVGGTGPDNIPVSKRLPHFDEQNYQHYLVDKKLGKRAAVSADYTTEAGRRTWRQAINLKVRESRVLDSVILELYQRSNTIPGNGFALTLEKALTKKVSVNGGYARIDRQYGPLNADRFNIDNRAFGMVTYNISPEFLASFFITTAVGQNGVLPQRTLSNTVVTYNVLPALRRTGLF
jgi:hypothetical protein